MLEMIDIGIDNATDVTTAAHSSIEIAFYILKEIELTKIQDTDTLWP